MACFLLIHGGFCRGWVWAETADALQEEGHRVEVIDLPSCGAEGDRLGDLAADVAAVRGALERIGVHVVLVAHSSSGVLLTEFADHPSVRHSVYLAAFWPQQGQSFADVSGDQIPDWMVLRNDGTAQVSPDPEVVRQALSADVDAERFAAEVHPRYVLQSLAGAASPSTAPKPAHPTTYIICEQDRAVPPQAQEAMSAGADHVVRLQSSHSPFLSMPKQLASVLDSIAARNDRGATLEAGGANS